MKHELAELIAQFLKETENSRWRVIGEEPVLVTPTFQDFIEWLV